MGKYEAFECDRCKSVQHADTAKGINLVIEEFPPTRQIAQKKSLCEMCSKAFLDFMTPGPTHMGQDKK